MECEFQAHNIALKTLRQRCEYLQQRLDSLEAENYNLKLKNSQENNKSPAALSASTEQIALLSKHKSQLTHQIQMVTMENKALWSQLSKLISGNNELGEQLSVSSVSNDHQYLKFSDSNNRITEDSSNYFFCDYNKESLEEISLKLINGILMGKHELENQYSQMIDLQRENDSAELQKCTLPFSQISNTFAVNSLKTYVQKLNDFKKTLYQQKYDLSDAIRKLKNYQKWFIDNQKNILCCDNSNNKNSGNAVPGISANQVSNQEVTVNEESSSSDMTCPICAESFTGDFKNFYEHVTDHFDNESDEFQDATASFEVVP